VHAPGEVGRANHNQPSMAEAVASQAFSGAGAGAGAGKFNNCGYDENKQDEDGDGDMGQSSGDDAFD